MILVVHKGSIYYVQSPIFLIFRGPQAPHFLTIFEKILGIICFYVNKSACHILVMICEPSRITNKASLHCSALLAAEVDTYITPLGLVAFTMHILKSFSKGQSVSIYWPDVSIHT